MNTYIFFVLIILQTDGYISSTEIEVSTFNKCMGAVEIYRNDFALIDKAIIKKRSKPGYVYSPEDDRSRLLFLNCEIRKAGRT